MLNSNIGTVILNGLLKGNSGTITFSGDVYLGLLTKLPNNNGSAYEDGSYFTEPSDPSYIRIKIDTKSRINKQNFIAAAQAGEPIDVGEDKALPAYVANQGAIMFEEATVAWDTVVGFGLFRSNNTADTTTLPFLWGTVTTDGGEAGVSVDKEEVPIIRTGGFKVSLV